LEVGNPMELLMKMLCIDFDDLKIIAHNLTNSHTKPKVINYKFEFYASAIIYW